LLRARITTFVRVFSGIAGGLAVLHFALVVVAFLSSINSFGPDDMAFTPERFFAFLTFILMVLLLVVSSFALLLKRRWGVVGLLIAVVLSLAEAIALTIVFSGAPDVWFVVGEIGVLALPSLIGAFWPGRQVGLAG
jgi:hypothetical protein